MNTQATAAKILMQIITYRHSLTTCLAKMDLVFRGGEMPVDAMHCQKNLMKELCFGVCRWYFRLSILANKLLEKPLKKKDQDIYLLILLGLYQLLYLNLPQHVAVSETVEAAKLFKKPWASKLINGVLRNFLRRQEQLLSIAESNLIGHFAHPQWMIALFKTAYPEQWQSMLTANNQRPPLCLRINLQKITVHDYLKELADKNIMAHFVADSPTALILEQAQDIKKLPGFQQGYFSVQDSSAQFAASLLQLKPGQRVLDACAAPGGKTAHILETEPDLAQLVAVDKEEERVKKIRENLHRLQLPNIVQYVAADAQQTKLWWDGKHFARILIDAPCSGSGVIRRHPDIKLLRQPEDIFSLAEQQYALLTALWPLLEPGGILVYATCSVFPQENELLMQRFLDAQDNSQELPITESWGIFKSVGRQIVTGDNNRDGFYYARVVKK